MSDKEGIKYHLAVVHWLLLSLVAARFLWLSTWVYTRIWLLTWKKKDYSMHMNSNNNSKKGQQ